MVDVLDPIELQTRPALEMDDEKFFRFCSQNRDYRIERTAEGNLVIMSPEASTSGSGNAELMHLIVQWSHADGSGRVFGSSAGFTLPNGAVRSPDISWVLKSRLKKASDWEKARFLALCPDFVLEMRSPSDRLPTLQKKMKEYISNGARLGWLIDPGPKTIYIYRPDAAVEILKNPVEIRGDPVLPKLTIPLARVWEAMEW